jgi:hypothetical protein
MDESFSLEEIGRVQALGLNDSMDNIEYYPIRKLTYKDSIFVEQMQRTHDCDDNDNLTSIEIDKDDSEEFLSTFKMEIYMDEE